MPDLYALARAARDEALRTDTAAARRLMTIYGEVYRRLSAEADALEAQLQAARERGERVTASQLYREGRLQALRSQAITQLREAEARALPVVREAISTARAEAAASSSSMVQAVTPPPSLLPSTISLPVGAINAAAALGAPGTPLAALYAAVAPEGAEAIERAIVTGLASGANPKAVARDVRKAIGGNAVRALTISRTEIMRAHREAAREEYLRHPTTIRGWVWVAGLGARTCPSCWAQNGSEHPLTEVMATHPNCRCVAAPLTVPWSDLGIPGMSEPDPVPDGSALFAQAGETLQRSVLGPSKYEAYRARQVRLEDFVARRQSPTWGASTHAASLDEARANAALRRAA